MADHQLDSLLAAASEQYRAGEYHEALLSCDTYLATYPQDAAALLLKGGILVAIERVDDAITTYKQVIIHSPQRPEPYAYLGELFDNAGDSDRALAFYQTAITLRPTWQPLIYNLAHIYLRVGQYKTALQHYQKALHLDPNDAKSHNEIGVIYEAFGHLNTAKKHYQASIKLAPNRTQARENLAAILLRMRELDQAIKLLEDSINVYPQRSSFYSLKAQGEQLLGQTSNALASALRAAQLDPTDPSTHENLGTLFSRLKQPSAALACFQRSLELDPENLDLYGYCAQMAIKLQQVDQAIEYFKQIFDRLNATNITQWLQALLLPQPKESLTDDVYELALKARHNFLSHLQLEAHFDDCHVSLSNLYTSWGNVRFKNRSYFEAEAYFEAATTVNPSNLRALEGLKMSQLQQAAIEKQKELPLTPLIPRWLVTKARDWLKQHAGADYFPLYESNAACYDAPTLRHECQGLNCRPCLGRIHETFSPIRLGKASYLCEYQATPTSQELDVFTAFIPDGRSWVMPQTSWWQVCEAIATIAPDGTLLADLSREYPGELPGCPLAAKNVGQHRIFQKRKLPPLEQVDGRVAVLCGLSANVYFHWLVDVLPRLAILRQSDFTEDSFDYFYVNSQSKRFQKETLKLLGIPLDRVIESDHHPHIQAKTLIVPSFAGYIGWATPRTINFLRTAFLPMSQHNNVEPDFLFSSTFTGKYPKRIYISRCSAKYRHIINEADLVDLLQEKGFKVIQLENYSFLDQVRLFSNAEIIVAAHGAGLTNLIFCTQDTTVIELFSPNYIRYYYWTICEYLRLKLYYLVGEALPCTTFRALMYPDTLTEDFLINLDQMKQVLNQAGF